MLLDSVQSQANRIEEALQDAVDEGRIQIPVVEVDFSDIPVVEPGDGAEGLFEPIGRVTSLATSTQIEALRDQDRSKQLRPEIHAVDERGATVEMASECHKAEAYAEWLNDPCVIPLDACSDGLSEISKSNWSIAV